MTILQHIKMLLCNDRKMDRYIRAVSGYWLSKHVPTATDMNAIIEQLVFYMVRAKML
jgi:hypothetical protein